MAIQKVDQGTYDQVTNKSKANNNYTIEAEKMQDNIIKTAQQVVDSELQKLSYNITVEAVVLNADNADSGEYKVRTGDNITYTAFSESTNKYAVNDIVYVTIPNGDYTQNKFILGRKTEVSEEGVYAYKFPFDDFVQLNELINVPLERGYRANQPDGDEGAESWSMGYGHDDPKTPLIGTKLGVTVDIQPLLLDYHPISGNYGLKIIVQGLTKNEKGEAATEYTRVFYLDVRHMYGNPYAQPVYVTQQAIFDLADAFSVSDVWVEFWQDPVNEPFINQYEQRIDYHLSDNAHSLCLPNLKFKNLAVYTGYATSEMEGSKVFLYTFDNTTYGQNTDDTSDRTKYDEKTCHLAFVYKNPEDGKYTLYDSDEELEAADAHVYWFLKEPGWYNDGTNPVYLDEDNDQSQAKDYDTCCGVAQWAPLKKNLGEGESHPCIISHYENERYNLAELTFTADLNDKTRDDYRFKVAIEKGGQFYTSDILIFSNEQAHNAMSQMYAFNDKVILRVAMMLSTADGTRCVMYPDESLQHFYVYDENNNVLCTDDKRDIEYQITGEDSPVHLKGYDNWKQSDIEYFVEIWIRDDSHIVKTGQRDLTSYVRLADWAEEDAEGRQRYLPFSVKWDVPFNDTMMNCYGLPAGYGGRENYVMSQDGQSVAIGSNSYYHERASIPVNWTGDTPTAWGESVTISTKFDLDRLTTCCFKIKDCYNFNNSNNTISAHIERNGEEFNAHRKFEFGKASMQGSPYTPLININLPEGNEYVVANNEFELECKIIDRWGKEYTEPYECTWSVITLGHEERIGLAPLTETTNWEKEPKLTTNGCKHSYNVDGTVRGTNAIIRCVAPTKCNPFVVRVDVTFTFDSESMPDEFKEWKNESLHQVRGMRIVDHDAFLTNHTITCPDKVQFTSGGQAPQYYTGKFICKHDCVTDDIKDEDKDIDTTYWINDNEQYFYPNWVLHVADETLKDVVYLKPQPKYISKMHLVGANNDTTYDINKNYMYLDYTTEQWVVYSRSDDDNEQTLWNEKVTQGKMFYSENVSYTTAYDTDESADVVNPPNVNEYNLLYGASGVGLDNGTQAIVSNVNTWVWRDGYEKNAVYLTYLTFELTWNWVKKTYNQQTWSWETTTGSSTVHFCQAIAFDRSLYPSSLINSWDGKSLTLDYDKGAILATMMAAGTKNSVTGAFTGVMMGNWTQYGDETFDNPDKRQNASGIYGFLEGASSFAFLDDGTGYIGPAGAGRIQFDGHNALISNGDKSCYINLNPTTISEMGDFYNTENNGISPYFLYCKVPVDSENLMLSSVEQKLTWADPFMKDLDNNYFVVDPRFGALMTGGVVAKYGHIGNWYISSSGLYQKYASEEAYEAEWEHVRYNPDTDEDLTGKTLYEYDDNTHEYNLTTDTIANSSKIYYKYQIKRNSDGTPKYKLYDGKKKFIGSSKSRFMYLGMPGVYDPSNGSGENSSTANKVMEVWNSFNAELTDLNNHEAMDKGEEIDDESASGLVSLVAELYNYLDKSAFTMDVYHYFNTNIAVKANLDYIIDILKDQNILDESGNVISTVDLSDEMIIGNVRNALYGKYELTTKLLDYHTVNQHCHNHYYNGNPSGAQYNLFDNIIEILGLTFSTPSLVYNRRLSNNGTALAIEWTDQYYEQSGINQTPGEYFYTKNDFGAERYFSYDPRVWQDSMNIQNRVNYSSTVTGNRTIYFEIVPASAGMPANKYWAPTPHSLDTDNIVWNKIWKNNTAASATITVNRTKLNHNTIDLNYIIYTLIPELKIYTSYYSQYFDQCLFYMLEKGLQNIEGTDNYNTAMAVINRAGGLEQIKRIGLSAFHSLTADFGFEEGISEELKQRIIAMRNQAITNYYDGLRAALYARRQQAVSDVYNSADADTYAIYAGYNAPYDWDDYSADNWDPMFGVKWNGYMIARHGKIGHDSPWYIGDAGLTQKNSSGIIFLGDPNQTGHDYSEEYEAWDKATAVNFTDANGNYLLYNGTRPINFLLPNDSKVVINGVTYTLRKPNIIYNNGVPSFEEIELTYDWETETGVAVLDSASNNGKFYYRGADNYTHESYIANFEDLGPEAYGEYGKFAIYAGNNGKIHIGIRMDGTLFADRAKFYNVTIDQSTIDNSESHNGTLFETEINNNYTQPVDEYGQPIGDPYYGYHVDPDSGTTTYTDPNGNTSTYYGGVTTYTDEDGNTHTISNTGQTFVAPDGNTYQIDGQGYSYINVNDGSYSYVDGTGMHFVTGYTAITDEEMFDGVSPATNNWYVYDQTTNTYVKSKDTIPIATTDYYKNSDGSQQVNKSDYSIKNPTTEKWYEYIKGDQPVYELTKDTEVDQTKSYYEKDSSGTYMWIDVQDKLDKNPSQEKWYEQTYKWYYTETTDTHVVYDNGGFKTYYKHNSDEVITFSYPTAIQQQQVDDAALAHSIMTRNLLLMGGDLTGWHTDKNTGTFACYKKGTTSDNHVKIIEAIALDAKNNQIRVADSQIVMNGTTGTLFIGRPYATNGESGASIYTSAYLGLARLAVIGNTVGATTYSSSITGTGEATQECTTFLPIQYGESSTGDDGINDANVTIGEATAPGDGEYVKPLKNDNIELQHYVDLINKSFKNLCGNNNNTLDIGMLVGEANPTFDSLTGIPQFEKNGIKIEFIPTLEIPTDWTYENDNDAMQESAFKSAGIQSGSIIFRPLQNQSILGTPEHLWNIYANHILMVDEYDGEFPKFSFAATKRYVDTNDALLQDNVIRVNDHAAKAFEKAVAALNAANAVLRQLKKFLRGELDLTNPEGSVDLTWLQGNLDLSEYVQAALNTLIGSGGTSTVTISGDLDSVSGDVSINIGTVSATGTVSGSLGAGSTLEALIEEMAEKSFKKGWNEAMAAVQGALSGTASATVEGGNSDSDSFSVSVVGGDGKNGISFNVDLELSSTEATTETDCTDASCSLTGSTTIDGTTYYTGHSFTQATHDSKIKDASTATATVSISFG